MTTDIVARLRELADTLSGAAYNNDPWGHLVRDPSAEMLRVAADRLEARDHHIEALEAEVAKLRGALEPFADKAGDYIYEDLANHGVVLISDLRRARAALAGDA